jgi:chromosome partitioning protein
MISILVANPKGGCGKTTVATNLAAAFAGEGRKSVLADLDRQHTSLDWLVRRPGWAAPIAGLNWSKEVGPPPKKAEVLIIDAPAAMRTKAVQDCLKLADVVVVPVLPSSFDQETTGRFLKRLRTLKPIRKEKAAVAVVRNRVRRRTRAAARLDLFMLGVGHNDLGWIQDRQLYNEAAAQGLGLFDLTDKIARELREDWRPLLNFIARVA